jgi:deoxyhypusine synthase
MGNNLTVDGYDCDRERLDSKELVRKVLSELPDLLGMTKLSEPQVVKHEAKTHKERGITGIVIIAESHISVHTYPEKAYIVMDIFSCKEFDVGKVIDYIKKTFAVGRVEQKLFARGHSEQFDADEKCEHVKGITLDKDTCVAELTDKMKNVGFQATHLGRAVDIIKKMKSKKAIIFFAFTSNMVSSGLRELFAQIVKEKKVNLIITSVGSVEEDLIKAHKPFLLGDFNADDKDLHRKGINRIGNIYVPNQRYELLEDLLMPFFASLYEKQSKTGKMISPSALIYELGKTVKDKNSILYWATKNNIPIFCPGITDGALGLQLYFFKQKHPDFGIDVTADMKELADITLSADKTGAIILGGGIAKHHTIGVNILRGGLDYAVYVTTATQYDGSLSGARTNEAVSWSKLKESANNVCVEGDATIIFPLIAPALLE